MGSYRVEWKRSATKELRRLDTPVIQKIVSTVERLTDDPFPPGVRKILGSERTYRIRIGDYRVIYTVVASRLVVEVVRIGHRKEVYRR